MRPPEAGLHIIHAAWHPGAPSCLCGLAAAAAWGHTPRAPAPPAAVGAAQEAAAAC